MGYMYDGTMFLLGRWFMTHALGWSIKAGAGFALIGATLALPHAVWAQSPTNGAPRVATIVLQADSKSAQAQWDGVIQPVLQSTVAAQVPGNIVMRPVKAGDVVRSGQTLAQVDARDTQAALDVRQAELAQAQAQLQNATQQWERNQSLRAQGFISAAAMDSAEAAKRSAQAAVNAAQAGRNQAALAKGFATVTAPFDGVVSATFAEVGDLAAPGRPLLSLYSPGQMRAVVQVPASQSPALKASAQAEVQTAQGWIKASKVTTLPNADPVSQTVEWRLDLPPGTPGLTPGQTTRVRWSGAPLPSGTPTASPSNKSPLTAPASAILQRGELTAVYVVRGQQFVLQAVRTGVISGSDPVALWSGVQAGDRIAVDAVKAGLAGATPLTVTP